MVLILGTNAPPVEELGKKHCRDIIKPSHSDLATICYTSVSLVQQVPCSVQLKFFALTRELLVYQKVTNFVNHFPRFTHFVQVFCSPMVTWLWRLNQISTDMPLALRSASPCCPIFHWHISTRFVGNVSFAPPFLKRRS